LCPPLSESLEFSGPLKRANTWIFLALIVVGLPDLLPFVVCKSGKTDGDVLEMKVRIFFECCCWVLLEKQKSVLCHPPEFAISRFRHIDKRDIKRLPFDSRPAK
jgi:hypothetical protein